MKLRFLLPFIILFLLLTGCRGEGGVSSPGSLSQGTAPVPQQSDTEPQHTAFLPQSSDRPSEAPSAAPESEPAAASGTVPPASDPVAQTPGPPPTSSAENDNAPEIHWISSDMGYLEKDGRCYLTDDGGESFTQVITREKATVFAEEEGQKDCYQYQPWESDFAPSDDALIVELCVVNDSVLDWSYIQPGERSYAWMVRLYDGNDPLTSLLVYVDVFTGVVIGAEQLSD